MRRSIFLARLVGPFLAVCGVALIFNTGPFRAIGTEMVASLALIYIGGLLALVAGLAIVNTHNVWTFDWRVAITLLGWLCLIGGVFRVVFPRTVQSIGVSILASVSNTWIVGDGVVILAFGAWISHAGYR